MKSKMMSVVICIIMVTSVFRVIPQNVGEQGPDPNSSDIFINSSPQDVEIPNLNSNEIVDQTDSPLQHIEATSLSLSGSGGLADSPWPMFSYNAQRIGLSPYNTHIIRVQIMAS